MKNLKLFLFALLIPALLFTSCKDEANNEASKSTHEILAEYLVSNGMDLPNILDSWIVAAPATEADVPTFVDSYNIIDIRSEEAYNANHIEGAVNSILTEVINKAGEFTEDKPVMVVCYTGQTAGHAVVALRLSGYDDAVVLKWGMSSWGPTWSDSWGTNTNTITSDNWSNTVKLSTTIPFSKPTISLSSSDGAAILSTQVSSMLVDGLSGIDASVVLETPTNYFINNYWAEADVAIYGHIAGAYRINPLSIADETIYNLDPNSTIVTYCWTGQTSSMITAYLNVLGYNAKSLKFGANGMIYNNLQVHKFVAPTTDLPTVPTK